MQPSTPRASSSREEALPVEENWHMPGSLHLYVAHRPFALEENASTMFDCVLVQHVCQASLLRDACIRYLQAET